MGRTKITILVALAFAIGGVAGGSATYAFFMREAISGMTSLGDISVASMYEMRVSVFGDTGTDEEYEAALNEYVAILDRLNAKNANPGDRASLALSKIATLGRLALVTGKRGASGESERFINLAVEECKSSKWKDCSRGKIQELALYFENKRAGRSTATPK
jgi:hypothetical protein